MQLRYEQLNHQTPLTPIYIVSGEEYLLVQTACDIIRTQAKKQGFSEREVFHADLHFDWQNFLLHCNNYGLFAAKQILELHLAKGVSEAAVQNIKNYVLNPPPDKILLIVTGKIDRRSQQTSWFQQSDKIGTIIFIWPMENPQLTAWISKRLSTFGLHAEDEAIKCLIAATEGNLLATAQEIEKLSLYFAVNTCQLITRDIMLRALADNAHYDPFKLSDAALQGEPTRCLRILHRLREESIEPLLILWSLTRECRQLARFAFQFNQGKNLTMLLQMHPLWKKRQLLLKQALQRHSLSHYYSLLRLAAHGDRIAKGVESGNIWQVLQKLSLAIAGVKIL
jgi:DNA polymerase III subunit delta